MPLVFFFFFLQQEPVQLSTFGRLLNGEDDELVGFEPARVRIEDPQVVAAGGETHYENALFNGRPDSRVSGMVFELTDAELAAADIYEQRAAYMRINATPASPKRACTRARPPPRRACATTWPSSCGWSTRG